MIPIDLEMFVRQQTMKDRKHLDRKQTMLSNDKYRGVWKRTSPPLITHSSFVVFYVEVTKSFKLIIRV